MMRASVVSRLSKQCLTAGISPDVSNPAHAKKLLLQPPFKQCFGSSKKPASFSILVLGGENDRKIYGKKAENKVTSGRKVAWEVPLFLKVGVWQFARQKRAIIAASFHAS